MGNRSKSSGAMANLHKMTGTWLSMLECGFCFPIRVRLVQSLSSLHRNTMVVLSSHVAIAPHINWSTFHDRGVRLKVHSSLCARCSSAGSVCQTLLHFYSRSVLADSVRYCAPAVYWFELASASMCVCESTHRLSHTGVCFRSQTRASMLITRWFYLRFFPAVVVTIWFGCVWRVLHCFRTEHLVRCVVDLTYTANWKYLCWSSATFQFRWSCWASRTQSARINILII